MFSKNNLQKSPKKHAKNQIQFSIFFDLFRVQINPNFEISDIY